MASRHASVRRIAILAAAILALTLAPSPALASSDLPALDPQLAAAFDKLATDLRALNPGQTDGEGDTDSRQEQSGENGDGGRLLESADQARRHAARGQLCLALSALNRLQRQLDPGRSDPEDGERSVSSAAITTVVNDILAIESLLLTRPGTARCGGGAPAGGALPAVQVTSSDTTQLTLHVSLPAAHFGTLSGGGQSYSALFMEGMGSSGAFGKPDVPVTSRPFALPAGAGVGFQLLGSSSYVLHGVRLWPAQHQPADGVFDNPPFMIDSRFYAGNSPHPGSPARAQATGTMRDLRLGTLEASGGQYQAASRTLRVFTGLDVRVTFTGENSRVFGDSRAASVWNRSYQRMYSDLVLNWNVAQAHLRPGIFDLCGEELLVITSPGLRMAADTYAVRRQADGFPARVVEVGAGEGQIGTTNSQIQAFIKAELTSTLCHLRPSYVTLFGDTANVPTFSVPTTYDVGFDGMIASDLPYALADKWPLANPNDLAASLAIGRIPAADLATANTLVSKILAYEDSPPFNFAFYSNAAFTSYFQGAGPQDERGFTKTSETIRSALMAGGRTVSRTYTADSGTVTPETYYDSTAIPAELRRPAFAWSGTTADVSTQINAGRFIVFHRDHGAPDGWFSPRFGPSDLGSLTNGALQPVAFSINCASAKFDDPGSPSFVEQLLQRSGGGAVGAFGDTRNSPSFTNNHLALGLFDAIFPNVLPAYGSGTPVLRLGDVLNLGKAYMQTQDGIDLQDATAAEHYLYHYLGDPTMQIWTHRPSIYLARQVSILFSESLLIRSSQAGLDGTVVTLHAGGQPLGRAVMSKGQAVISLPPTLPPLGVEGGGLTLSFDGDGFQAHHMLVGGRPPLT